MQVLVGSPPAPPATVKVAAQPAPLPPPPAAAAAAAAAAPPTPALPLSRLSSATAGTPPTDVAAELALQLEYTAGVWRSHSCSLQLPLQQPANISAAALQLPGGAVAVSITLSLEPDASSSLLLLEAALRPQYGLVLSGSCSSGSSGGGGLGFGGPCLGEVLPMRVLPGGSAALCFMLVQDQGDKLTGSFEADGSSLLQLSYCLETAAAQPAAAAADTVTITDPSTALLQQQQHAQNPSKSEAAKPWWSGGSASGTVRLGRAGGALAAVEVVIVPQVAGRQLPPRLLLRGLGGSQPLLVEAGVAGGLWVEEELCMHISG
ncbi:hypothetical protein OEZ86_003631 [Tetradesmus obliquus]|nr:hypothetical protein OEZ86_003631 [Tetradesmus obliquus]